VVGWASPHEARPRPVVHFVFDGGTLAEDVPIQLQEDELDEFRFVEPAALDDYLPGDHQHPGGRRAACPGRRDDRLPAVDRALAGAGR